MTHAGYVFAGWGRGLGVIGLYAWSVIRRGITPEINAIGTIIVGISIILILVSVFIMHEDNQRAGPVRK